MSSIHHRGTEENPGLVLALDPHDQGSCHGVAFRVPGAEVGATVEVLRERELISSAYYEEEVSLLAEDGARITALAYVIDPDHRQYCRFSLEQQAQMIARAVGGRGPNTEYLFNTAEHLKQLQIKDDEIDWLVKRTRALMAT